MGVGRGPAQSVETASAAARRHRCGACLWLLCWTIGAVLAVTPAVAQEPTDVVIEIHNGTTNQPGQAEQVVVERLGSVQQIVGMIDNVSGTGTFYDLPLHAGREYLLTTTFEGVDYFRKLSGRQLAGEPVRLYVFDVSNELSGLSISGMNLIIRRAGSRLSLEYLLTIVNEARPQVSVVGRPAAVGLALPPGAFAIVADELRGARPREIETTPLSGRLTGLAIAIAPGTNRLRLTASVEHDDPTTVPVSFNLAVDQWSLITSPPDLKVSGRGLEKDDELSNDDLVRHIGPQLEPDRLIKLVIGGGAVAQDGQEIFTQPAPEESTEAAPASASKNKTARRLVPIGLLAGVLLVIWVVIRKLRGAD